MMLKSVAKWECHYASTTIVREKKCTYIYEKPRVVPEIEQEEEQDGKKKGTPASCNIKKKQAADYLPCDDTGHIMARRFGGNGITYNTVPMNKFV